MKILNQYFLKSKLQIQNRFNIGIVKKSLVEVIKSEVKFNF